MSQILQGAINVYTAGRNITGRPSPVLQIIAAKSTGIFPNILFVLLLVTPIVMVVAYKTKWGLKRFGTGTNKTAAYLAGVYVKRVRFTSFVASGVPASLIGLLLLGNMGIAFKDMVSNYVMPSIAAVVVGGGVTHRRRRQFPRHHTRRHFPADAHQPPGGPGVGRRGEAAGIRNRPLHTIDRAREQPAQQIGAPPSSAVIQET